MDADLVMVIGNILSLENVPAEQRALFGVNLVPRTLQTGRRQCFHPLAEMLCRSIEVGVADGGEKMIYNGVVSVGFGGASSCGKDRERQ